MATHTHLPIYKVAYDLLGIIAGLANTLRQRGHGVKADFTKTYRKSA